MKRTLTIKILNKFCKGFLVTNSNTYQVHGVMQYIVNFSIDVIVLRIRKSKNKQRNTLLYEGN